MIIAEQQGITSETVKPSFLESSGTDLGLVPQAAYHVIRQVGNYGEVFEKHVGHKSEFKLKRGANALEEDGGLAAPFVIR